MIKDQAIDRVHRLGQTRETTVWRLVMENTVEERVLTIQSEKRELVGKAFQEKKRKGKKTKDTRMADVTKLLIWEAFLGVLGPIMGAGLGGIDGFYSG